MALSPIMLTAWAVAEIPGLEIDGYRDTTTDDCDRVLARTTDDRLITIASPRTAQFAALQDSEHRVGQLLSAGVRDRLPFAVPHTLAAGTIGNRRVVITEEIRGNSLASLKDPLPALPSLARALAAIHNLPTSIVTRNIIPTRSSLDCLRDAAGLIDRAHHTAKVPPALLDRWDAAIEDAGMWQFSTTITHGDVDFDAIIVDELGVSGIINWSSARVGDPADDLYTIIGRVAPTTVGEFSEIYLGARPTHDPRILHRARFLSELGIARWLVHGVDVADEAIIADAVGMLTALLGNVTDNPDFDLGAPKKAPTTFSLGDDVPSLPASLERGAPGADPDRPVEPVTEPL